LLRPHLKVSKPYFQEITHRMHPNRLVTALLILIAAAGASAERKSAAAEEITLVMDAFKAIAAVQEPTRGHFEDLLEAEISSFGCELNQFLYADGNIRCSGQLLRFAGRWGLGKVCTTHPLVCPTPRDEADAGRFAQPTDFCP
jgi:hypothetical protein